MGAPTDKYKVAVSGVEWDRSRGHKNRVTRCCCVAIFSSEKRLRKELNLLRLLGKVKDKNSDSRHGRREQLWRTGILTGPDVCTSRRQLQGHSPHESLPM